MTVWIIAAAVLSFGITALSGYKVIPYLRKLNFGQTILEIGPRWHKNKQGTPTMGGFMFIAGILIALAVCFPLAANSGNAVGMLANSQLLFGVLMAVAFGAMGFADDYVKVAKKRNLGLTAKQKLVVQFAIAALYLLSMHLAGSTVTSVRIPFFNVMWHLGWLYYPLCAIGIVFITNSVNLTDGLDGLASSVTLMSCLGFLAIAVFWHKDQVSLLAAAAAGGCLGFLVHNFYPARVFMGDTGSMFLGGCICALAFGLDLPLYLAMLGFIYICESMSVVLQVISFKTTGKRIFKMSPIHHHFEMSGYSEVQIVLAFSAITLILAVVAFIAACRI